MFFSFKSPLLKKVTGPFYNERMGMSTIEDIRVYSIEYTLGWIFFPEQE